MDISVLSVFLYLHHLVGEGTKLVIEHHLDKYICYPFWSFELTLEGSNIVSMPNFRNIPRLINRQKPWPSPRLGRSKDSGKAPAQVSHFQLQRRAPFPYTNNHKELYPKAHSHSRTVILPMMNVYRLNERVPNIVRSIATFAVALATRWSTAVILTRSSNKGWPYG